MDTSSENSSELRYKPLLGLFIGNFAIGTSALMISGIVEAMSGSLGNSIGSIASLITIYSLSYALSAIFIGIPLSKFDLKKVLLFGLILFAAGNILTFLSTDIKYIYIYRVFVGIGASLFTPMSSAVASQVSPREHIGKAVSFSFSGLSLATVVGVPLCAYIATTIDWKLAFLFVVIVAVLSFFKLLVDIEDNVKGLSQNINDVLVSLMSFSKLTQLSFSLVQMCLQFITFALLVPYSRTKEGFDANLIPTLFLAFGISSFLGTIIGGKLIDKRGSRKSMIFTTMMLSVAFLLLNLSVSIYSFAAFLFLWGFFGFSFHPMQQVELIKLSKGSPAVLLSLNAAFMYLGTAAGTEIAKKVVLLGNIDMLPRLSAILSLFLTLCLIIQKRLTNQSTQTLTQERGSQ